MSTRLRCQTSEEIEEVLEDSAGHFFLNTRGLAFMRKMVTFHPTWRTVIKANSSHYQTCKVLVGKQVGFGKDEKLQSWIS